MTFSGNRLAFAMSCLVLVAVPNIGARAQDASAGAMLFRQRCSACHALDAAQKRVGPHLDGVVGRHAGSVEGARYSKGMQALGVQWNAESLDRFLTNPRQMVPGSFMPISVGNAADRHNIISYLESVSVQPAN
ncbi:c-type cytochrome [Rhizobium sp. Rhizsp42]|uniref:c-type cytochrome n=1 Tax=Rhizobium sp. Rhizsp42 TaxID=3243034 RepID=UPI0039AF93A3